MMQPEPTHPHDSMVTRVFEREESPFDIKCQFMKLVLVILPGKGLGVAQLQETATHPLES